MHPGARGHRAQQLMSAFKLTPDLIRKYNVPVPRYTSYPPATFFAETTAEKAIRAIQPELSRKQDISLYIHIPFCRSLCWYCGCTSIITAKQEASVHYLARLKKEINLAASFLTGNNKVTQLHLGGGTPTFLRPEEILEIGSQVHSRFSLDTGLEAAVEVDPRGFTQEHAAALREAGFNRASIGVQDFDPSVQRAVHRIQPKALTEQTVHWLRKNGFLSLNIDLICGLPLQTPESFDRTLETALELRPDRFAIFNYAHVPWLKHAQRVLEKRLPSPETKIEIFLRAAEKLVSHKFVHIGMDHFARDQDDLAVAMRNKTLHRNFQGYSTRRCENVIGFGMSAISQSTRMYWQNHKTLPLYEHALDSGSLPVAKCLVLTDDDIIRRHVITRLLCDMSLDFSALSKQLNVDFTDYFARELNALTTLENDGVIDLDHQRLIVTDQGRLFVRNVAAHFDARTVHNKAQQHSRTL